MYLVCHLTTLGPNLSQMDFSFRRHSYQIRIFWKTCGRKTHDLKTPVIVHLRKGKKESIKISVSVIFRVLKIKYSEGLFILTVNTKILIKIPLLIFGY